MHKSDTEFPAAHEWENDEEFRIFKKRLYHSSIAHILSPLRPGMETPRVMRCPDGHFRRAIFEIGPFIADYPEQVYLSGIVQGWCPKYALELRFPLTFADQMPDVLRFRRMTLEKEILVRACSMNGLKRHTPRTIFGMCLG